MAYPRLSNVQILKLSPTHPYLGLRPIESNWRLRAHRIRATWQAGDNQMYRSSALVQILGTYLLGARPTASGHVSIGPNSVYRWQCGFARLYFVTSFDQLYIGPRQPSLHITPGHSCRSSVVLGALIAAISPAWLSVLRLAAGMAGLHGDQSRSQEGSEVSRLLFTIWWKQLGPMLTNGRRAYLSPRTLSSRYRCTHSAPNHSSQCSGSSTWRQTSISLDLPSWRLSWAWHLVETQGRR